MAEQEYFIKANKTKLYELVKRHFEMPVEYQQTTFSATPFNYMLSFLFDGRLYRFNLDVSGALVRNVEDLRGNTAPTMDVVYVKRAELMELGLAQTVQKAL